MRFQGEFETIKMIEQGGIMSCCAEYTEGQMLIHMIKNGETIKKRQLWKWLQDICTQIDGYHRYYHRAYQYINPYTIFVSDEQSIKLLDLDAQENEKMLIYLQKNIIRESFSRTNGIKKTKMYTDFYSIGRTFQFILSSGNITPKINMIESYKLSKIIKKCLEESPQITFQNIREIQKQLPK